MNENPHQPSPIPTPGESLTASGQVRANASTIADGGPGAMPLGPEQELQVLLMQLQERYNAAHKMRARGVQFTLWISGMAIALCWIIVSKGFLPLGQKLTISGLAVILAVGAIYFLSGLAKGFHKNRQAMIRTESALGLHSEGLFPGQGSILPSEYRNAKKRWSDHFNTLMVLLALIGLALGSLVWLTPYEQANQTPHVKIEQLYKGAKTNG